MWSQLNEKQEESDPIAQVSWRPFVLDADMAKSFDIQLHANANWLVISEVFSLPAPGSLWARYMQELWQLSLSCSSPPFQQGLPTRESLHKEVETIKKMGQIIQANTEDNNIF